MGNILSTSPLVYKKFQKKKKYNIKNSKSSKYNEQKIVIGEVIEPSGTQDLINNNKLLDCLHNSFDEIKSPEQDINNKFIWIALDVYDNKFRSCQEVDGFNVKQKYDLDNPNSCKYWLCKPRKQLLIS